MATPRGMLSIPILVGSGEQAIVAASVPTMAERMTLTVHGASIVFTGQPTTLASILTGSSGHLLTPAISPHNTYGDPNLLRWRDLGAAGILVITFIQGNHGL